MPNIDVLDMAGKKVGETELSEAVFGIEPNTVVMHHSPLLLEVRGGGRKPWKQKGTGHARQGSTRAPQWTHGGVVFAPKPRSYRFSVNKKVKRLAMKSAFSSKLSDSEIVVLEKLTLDEYKTKTIAEMLKAIGADKKALIVLSEVDKKVINSARNIPGVKTAQVNTLNVYDIVNADKLVIVKDAVSKIEEVYS